MSQNAILASFETASFEEVNAYMHNQLTPVQQFELADDDSLDTPLEVILSVLGNGVERKFQA